MRVVCGGWVSAHGYFLGIWLLRMKCMGFASCIIWKKTADNADAAFGCATRRCRSLTFATCFAAALALPKNIAHLFSAAPKRLRSRFCRRQNSDELRAEGASALSAVFPHLSKAYNTFILNLSETLNANSFSRLSRSFRGGKSPVLRTFARHSVVLMTRASSRLAQALSHYRKSYRLAHASRLKPLSSCLAAIAQSKNTEKLGKTLKQ